MAADGEPWNHPITGGCVEVTVTGAGVAQTD